MTMETEVRKEVSINHHRLSECNWNYPCFLLNLCQCLTKQILISKFMYLFILESKVQKI